MEKRITILHLCEHFGSKGSSLHGVARGFQWWLPKFDDTRYRILLCSRRGYDKAAEQMIHSGIEPLYLGYGKLDPRNLRSLLRMVKTENIDIIHAHGYGACLWAQLAGRILKKHVIVHERCNYRTVPWFQRPIEWFFGPSTKHAFAVSESTRKFCIDKRHIPADAVEVIYNGIPLEDITIMSPEWLQKKRAEYNVLPTQKIIGLVCRLESYKGIMDAFEAFRRILEICPDTVFWLAGDGPYEKILQDWVGKNKLEHKVTFLGFVPNIREVMQCFDIQVFPSYQEGTPNTLYEALAVGNTMVASTTDGQGEILDAENTALLFTPGDVDKMAKHLERVLKDDELRGKLSKNALEKSVQFDGQRCIDRMQAKYDQIMITGGDSAS